MLHSEHTQGPPSKGNVRMKESRLLSRMVHSLQEVSTKGLSSSEETAGRLFLKQNRIVGREHELLLLNNVYQRVSKSRSEVVLIHGASGAGKSTLLEAFVRELPPSVFYVNGKFDQLQSHAPYAALVSASEQLCRQALRRENSKDIRDRLRETLGSEINLLGILIPTIAKMTADMKDGDATSTACVGGQGFMRFKQLFRAFLRCVASRENPVILFLDDIQWADGASLEVIRALVTDGLSKHIMIIEAYRDGEIDSSILYKYHVSDESANDSDGLTSCTASVASTHRAHITDITVVCLDVNSLNDLIASMLGMDKFETASLSTLVLNKTDGNAFYVLNFLDMLLRRCLLSKTDDGSWTWDEQQILEKTNVTDNLAAILQAKLWDLPEQVRSILQIASFIGHSFTTEILVTIVHEEQDIIETKHTFEKHSREVIHGQIIMTLKVALAEGVLETTAEDNEFKFSHDKVQQCLYLDLIPDDVERMLLHQRIGALIWISVKSNRTSNVDNCVFLAAENLNRAVSLADYSGTRYDLIEVNLRAAKLAMERSAFLVASDYLRVAVSVLEGDTSWDNRYELCIDLYSTAAEAEKNIACYGRSRKLVEEIHKRAKSFQHELDAYSIEMQSLAAQGKVEESVLLGLDVLRKVGVKFPRKITTGTVVKELMLAKIVIGKRSLEDLLELPEMTDQNSLFALNLMNIVVINSLILGDSYKDTYAAAALRMVRMSVRHGLSPLFSPIAFAAWGSVHAVLGCFDISLRAEKLSLIIIEKFNTESVRGRTMILNYNLSHLWRSALDDGVRREFLRAYHLSMSFGDISFGYYGFVGWLCTGVYLDEPLHEIHRRTRYVVAEGREYELITLLIFILPAWQLLLNLSGDTKNSDPGSLMGEAVDDKVLMEVKVLNSQLAFYALHMWELILAYTYEDWDVIQQSLPLQRKFEKGGAGHFCSGFAYTWSAVCHYELYLTSGKRKHKQEGRRCHRFVKKWATTGTIMLAGANKWLTAMESLCVKKLQLHKVENLFQKAFVALSENKNIFLEAVATERLARFYVTEGTEAAKGRLHLWRSIELYRRWGAFAKAEWLEKRYSQPASQPSAPKAVIRLL